MKICPFFCLLFLTAGFAEEDDGNYLSENSIQFQEGCTLPSAREEKELFSQINSESRRLYNSLDCEGKNRALELSRHYRDKNGAIQQAAREMGKRQQEEYPNQRAYKNRIEEQSGQKPYRRRFGY